MCEIVVENAAIWLLLQDYFDVLLTKPANVSEAG